MAKIIDPKLTLNYDKARKVADIKVTCTINFTDMELCQMRSCSGRWFKLKCSLWGRDYREVSIFPPFYDNTDDKLYTIGAVHYFPDANASANEARSFQVTLGEGVLDEDRLPNNEGDELYALLELTNLFTENVKKAKSNVVSRTF